VSIGATAIAAGYVPADSGRTGLVAWDLDARRPVLRLEWPPDGKQHLLGDLTVGPDGTVYASDALAGAVRVVRPGGRSIETLMPEGGFDSPQGPAVSADGRRLYVADYSRGIGIVDLGSGARSWMRFAPGVALQGIDGLYVHGRELIAVQNGTRPKRIVRLRLDATGTHVLEATRIESGTRRLGEPTHGVVVGSRFWFLANTGWERVEDDVLKSDNAAPASIWSVELGGVAKREHAGSAARAR
jgi:hypothetical protein